MRNRDRFLLCVLGKRGKIQSFINVIFLYHIVGVNCHFLKEKKCWQEFHVGSAWASFCYYCPSSQRQQQQRGNQQVSFCESFVSSMRFHIRISFVPLFFFLLQSVNGTVVVQTIKTTTTPKTTTTATTISSTRDGREYRVHPPDSNNTTQLQSELTQPPKGIGSEYI